MTRKEFESLRIDIEKEKLQLDREVGPLEFAAKRAAFRKTQLQTLIKLAQKVKDSKTVAAKLKRWERLSAKCDGVQDRFQQYDPGRGTVQP